MKMKLMLEGKEVVIEGDRDVVLAVSRNIKGPTYLSSSRGEIPIATMAVPHIMNAIAKKLRGKFFAANSEEEREAILSYARYAQLFKEAFVPEDEELHNLAVELERRHS